MAHFNAKKMIKFRKVANRFLGEGAKFEEAFQPKIKKNTLDPRIINTIKFYVDNVDLVGQAKEVDSNDPCKVTVTDLKLAAEAMETISLETSYRLICAAVKLRPNGQKLREILTDYEKDLKNGIKVRKPPYEGKLSLLRKLFSF